MAKAATIDVPVRLQLDGKDLAAVVVRPGDRLVINLGPRVTCGQAMAVRDQVREAAPDLRDRVLVVAAEQLAVIRATEDPDT